MNVKKNLKYQSTHKEIMAALLEALKIKDIRQVTVAELCRAVGINRSTFYEHFLDVYDVLEKLADEISAEVPLPSPARRPEAFIALFEHIRRHKEFYLLYFRQGLPVSIQKRLFFYDPPAPPGEQNVLADEDEVEGEYRHAYYRAAIEAIIRHWLERDCAETPERLCDILRKDFPHN